MNILKKVMATSALLFVSSQASAICWPWSLGNPQFSGTQDVTQDQNYVLNITISGVPGGCQSAPGGATSSFEMPYFSDINAQISTPTGWSYTIQDHSGSNLDTILHVPTIKFSANDPSYFVQNGSTLSGFVFTSKYAAVSSPYVAGVHLNFTLFATDSYVDNLYVDEYLDASNYSLIPGSPLIYAALTTPYHVPAPVDLPQAAVPEPSTAGMLSAGMVLISFAARRRQRGQQRLLQS